MPRVWSDASASDDPGRDRNEQARKAQQARTSRRAEGAAVGERGMRFHSGGKTRYEGGGGVEVEEGGEVNVNGGNLRLTSADGTQGVFFIGNSINGNRIWMGSFPNGSQAFGLFGSAEPGFWGGHDHGGNLILANDALSGAGLAKPYLNIPMVPSAGTSIGTGGPFWPEFVNASYQEVFHCITTLWHPRIAIGVDTSTASGTVDWELRVDGVTAGSGSGDGAGEFSVPGWGSTTLPGDQRSVQLWCRNTTGTASRVIVDRCYGTQS